MPPDAKPPSLQSPLGGGCLCGEVRFELSAAFSSAGYCHCTHCQRRTGTAVSASARVPRSGLRLLRGGEHLQSFQPNAQSNPKVFCRLCGSHLFSGDPLAGAEVAVRFGALDGDPGIRPQYRQWVDSAATWEPIPDDGLPRHDGPRQD